MSISIAGGKSIPEPFNENDVTVWNALICKHVCLNKNTAFNESDFLDDVIDDRILPIGAYNKEIMKKTRAGEQNEYHRLLKHCLEFLLKNRLLEGKREKNPRGIDNEAYFATDRLRSMCPEIGRIMMFGIEPVLYAETKIREEKDYQKIVKFLEHLKKVNEVRKSEAIKYITGSELRKLIQLGIIALYLNERVTLTAQGNLLRPLLA